MEKRIWTNEETRAFLNAYIVRKKKYAMQNVLLDLESQGVLSQPTTTEMLSTKSKNLVRAYKQSVDNNRRTGATPCNAPYADLMDEIFGDSPIISNNHSVNLYGKPLGQSKTSAEENETPSTSRGPTITSSSLQQSNGQKRRTTLKEKTSVMKIKTKKEAADEKLKLLEKYTKQKLEKMEGAPQLKQKRHDEKMALLKALIDSQSS